MSGDFGTTLDIEATDVCPAPYYMGEIETEDGTIEAGIQPELPGGAV